MHTGGDDQGRRGQGPCTAKVKYPGLAFQLMRPSGALAELAEVRLELVSARERAFELVSRPLRYRPRCSGPSAWTSQPGPSPKSPERANRSRVVQIPSPRSHLPGLSRITRQSPVRARFLFHSLLALTPPTPFSAIDHNDNMILDELHNPRNLHIHGIGRRPLPCLPDHSLTPWRIPIQARYSCNYRTHVIPRNQYASRPIAKCGSYSAYGGSDHWKPGGGGFVQHLWLPFGQGNVEK